MAVVSKKGVKSETKTEAVKPAVVAEVKPTRVLPTLPTVSPVASQPRDWFGCRPDITGRTHRIDLSFVALAAESDESTATVAELLQMVNAGAAKPTTAASISAHIGFLLSSRRAGEKPVIEAAGRGQYRLSEYGRELAKATITELRGKPTTKKTAGKKAGKK